MNSIDSGLIPCFQGDDAAIRECERLREINGELLAALKAAREELRLIRMKDCNRVYNPTLNAQINLAITKARGES